MRIAEISVRRPVFALMLTAGLVTLGLVSLARLELALDPDVDYPFVTVTTVLRGASPDTVEREVTDVLEEQVNTIEGLRSLRSTSSEGVSEVFAEFELGQDVDRKAQEVRERVAIARPLLPLDVEEPVVARVDPDAMPILSVMLGGAVSIRELSDFAEHVLADRLERLPGVGSVAVVGGRQREIRIWLDPVQMAGYGLAIGEIAAVLERENVELAGGRIEGAEREWSVTTAGKVGTVEDFGRLIVTQKAGPLVYLSDVASVEDGLQEESSIARLNGQRGVSLEVRRQSGANIVSVARAVREEIDRLRAELPPGMTVVIARDLAVFIEKSIVGVFEDMLLAGALVVAVVLLFLRSWRSTLIAGLAIPSSVLASFTFFYVADFTLNSMTLMALSLAIGLVIDDAIVVVESIYRGLERGETRKAACEQGPREVGLAVISTTLAVCAVFVPIAFMQGMIGQWFYEFGMVVVIAVSASTLVALTLTPMVSSLILRVEEHRRGLFGLLERAHAALDALYARTLGWALARPRATLGIALVTVMAGCGVASTLPIDFYRQSDRGEFSAGIRLPVGTPLAVTEAASRRMERVIASHPDVRLVFTTVGSAQAHRPHLASAFISIGPKEDRERTQTEVMHELRPQLLAALPEAEEVTVSHIGWSSGTGRRSASLTYTLRGPDLERLAGHAEGLLARMRADPAFVDVGSTWETGKPQIRLELDRERAADLGVPAAAVGRTLRTLLAGEEVGSFEEHGRRYDVRVQVLPQYRDDPDELHLIRVRSLRGELVPLVNVGRPRIGEGAVEITRENRAREITVYANLVGDAPLGDAAAKLEAWADEIGVSPPDEFVPSGSARAMREAGAAIVFAFVLAMAAIYMILASLFNSLIHPFTIMMSAPLAFIGGFLALSVLGLSLDMMSGIGLLVLMGLVMKNGILLVDYTNQLRAEGLSREEALRRAGPVRMRPVLMTTLALIFGLMPVALGSSSGSEFRRPMGAITVGGLITSTLLTLVVVPVVYQQLDRLAALPSALARRWERRREASLGRAER
jgi:HAE1 family hydrophobic/amphiphilic exporter-1